MSPHTATSRPMWNRRIAKPRICNPSRAASEHDDALGGDDRLDQRIRAVLRQLGEDPPRSLNARFDNSDRVSLIPAPAFLLRRSSHRLALDDRAFDLDLRSGRLPGRAVRSNSSSAASAPISKCGSRTVVSGGMQVSRDLAIVVAHDRDVVGNFQRRVRAAPRSSRPPSDRWRRRSRSAAKAAASAHACVVARNRLPVAVAHQIGIERQVGGRQRLTIALAVGAARLPCSARR